MSESISFKELCKLIQSYKSRKVSITFHTIGDRDSVSSAVLLSEFLGEAEIITPDFITRNAERMLKDLNYKDIISKPIDKPEAIIVLDTNTIETLGGLKPQIQKSDAEILFIDHHTAPREPYARAKIFDDESFNSTSSIIYEALNELGFKFTDRNSRLILYGIVSDSAGFKNATALTFKQISSLLTILNADFAEIMYNTSSVSPPQTRIEEINDMLKSKIEKCGSYIIMYGKTSMHANEVAERAIGIGADVAVFWSVNKKEASISTRLYPSLDKKLNLHLGKVMQDAAPLIDGNGGGHPCAAGAYGPKISGAEQAVSKVIAEIKEKMGK